MDTAPTFRSRFIRERLQARKGDVDLVLRDVEKEQDICRKEVRRLIIQFKNWQPVPVERRTQHDEHTPCAQVARGA